MLRRAVIPVLLGGGFVLFSGCSSRVRTVAKEESPGSGPAATPGHGRRALAADAASGDEPPPPGSWMDVDWQTLRGLDFRTGQVNPLVELVVGANVRISGYLVPFDDAIEETSEFLIVPGAGMCVHTPPPPPNQMVLAQATGRPPKMLTGAVWVYGKLDLDTGNSPYGQTAYRMTAEAIRPYR